MKDLIKLENGQGLHIGFSGIDGAGKSTQAALLYGWLSNQGIHCILREGKRDFVSEISSILAKKYEISSGREYLGEDYYMLALSFDLLREIILDINPFVQAGAVVISARTQFCRLASGIVRGCHSIPFATDIALIGGYPDILFLLDLPAEIACKRVIERGIDSADLNHLKAYREALVKLLQVYNYIYIDSTGSIQQVHREIRQIIKDKLV